MGPPRNVSRRLTHSLLRTPDSATPGLDIVLHAVLSLRDREAILGQVGGEFDLESLRFVDGFPPGCLFVVPADSIAPAQLPAPALPSLAAAVLACSGTTLFDPRRPLVFTEMRLSRSLALVSPHAYYHIR
jgi:hypothetical protein